MRIKKLILYKFKRFLLSNIELLEYTPKNTIQMIASRNLAGKSSLLRQLNPLPADIKKDFKEDGYKIIEIEHLGKEYILTSNTKHSFLCNGTELNPGGTRKVQLELVKEHFNITPAIMDILYNINKITFMSPNERKYWFTEMSSVDYTFPIKVFKMLKQQQRDYVGGIKLVQENIMKSELNQKSKEEIERLLENRKNLEKYIEYINSLYDHNNRTNPNLDIYTERKDLTNSIISLSKELDEFPLQYTLSEMLYNKSKWEIEIEQVKKDKERIVKEIETIEALIHLGDKIKLQEELSLLYNRGKELDDKYRNIEEVEALLDNRDENTTAIFKPIVDGYKTLYGELIGYLTELQQYDDIRLKPKEEKDKIIKDYDQYCLVKEKLNSLISKVKAEIEHLVKHKTDEFKLTCPKCSHIYYNGYSENGMKMAQDLLKQYEEKLTLCNKKIEILKIDVEKIKASDTITEQIKYLIRNRPETAIIWKIVFKDNSFQTSTVSSIISSLNSISPMLEDWLEIDSLMSKCVTICKSIKQIEEAEKANIAMNKNRSKQLEEDLTKATKLENDLIKNIQLANSFIDKATRLKNSYEKLTEINKDIHKGYDAEVIKLRNETLTKLSSELKGMLIEIDNTLSESKLALDSLVNNKKLLEDYKEKEKILGIVSKELSPDEGLIAKSINSFISVIVEEMNTIINSIWTYDLEILPCEVSEENDLDYKFKVRVNNDHIVEDIGKLSSSGLEIVELAFRLVFAKYIGLIDVPLYLDEFGATFDEAHRASAYSVIDKILSSDYGQIYIVCHYKSIFGALKNVDFNVLDANNIDLDPSILTNEVFKIKYYN